MAKATISITSDHFNDANLLVNAKGMIDVLQKKYNETLAYPYLFDVNLVSQEPDKRIDRALKDTDNPARCALEFVVNLLSDRFKQLLNEEFENIKGHLHETVNELNKEEHLNVDEKIVQLAGILQRASNLMIELDKYGFSMGFASSPPANS